MDQIPTDIWQAQERLGRRLLEWGILNIAIGALLSALPDRFWRGFGSQATGWGLVDAAIAWLGIRSARGKAGALASHTPERQNQARDTLRRILWINSGLDVAYITGGLVLAATKGHRDRFWRGSGLSIAVQGGALLLFDILHALHLRVAAPVERGLGDDSGHY